MHIVYAQEAAPQAYTKSIFLVGPTPRDRETESWRPYMLSVLEGLGYDGVVFTPEPRDGKWTGDYDSQVEWESKHLELADIIIAWVPRKSPGMPAFTTNVEFGEWLRSGKLLYGRPPWAEKCRYLDSKYTEHGHGLPYATEEDIAQAALDRLGNGAFRGGGERSIPLHVWNTKMFQSWYKSQKAAGNRLDDAKVLWTFTIKKVNVLFSYALWVKVWVEAEKRHKENEFLLSRNDISCILPFWRNPDSGDVLDSKIVLVKEFRSPVRNSDSMVYELPGGSTFKGVDNAKQVASDELREETGLAIPSDRFFQVQSRQMVSTFATQTATLFAVELTDNEIAYAETLAQHHAAFGVSEDTEKTYVVVKTLRDAILTDVVDWAMIGMSINGLVHGTQQNGPGDR